MQNRFLLRFIVLLLLAAGVGIAVFQALSGDGEALEPGDQAPDFQLETLQGEPFRLSDLRGQGVLLNFWGSWCKPCEEEMPALEKVYRELKDKQVTVVGVNIGETEVAVDSFVERYGLHFPIVLDKDREVTRLYRIGPIPTTYFIKPDGTIASVIVGGPMAEETIRSRLLQVAP
ncbi:thiol-disulfide oxidoreductase ResA [Bacillaceae bacterium]